VFWGYDLLNRTLYARTGSASGPGPSFVYDALGRVTSTTQNGQTLSYAYDAAGNRTALTWPDTGSNALTVSYLRRAEQRHQGRGERRHLGPRAAGDLFV
jgi:YD repeat-containing protein